MGSFVAIPGRGPWFPPLPEGVTGFSAPATAILDAAGEYVYIYGQIFWADRGSHTVSSAGGKIHFRIGAATWSSAGSNVRVGLQDYGSAATPIRPDGTFDVYADITQPAALTGSAVNIATMGSGTKTLAHCAEVCVVYELTVRNGADQIAAALIGASGSGYAYGGFYTGGSLTFDIRGFTSTIEADDGTLGYIVPLPALSNLGTEAYSNSTNPDERGLIFQVDEKVKVDYFEVMLSPGGSTGADAEIRVYSDPLGTPTLIGSALTILAESMTNGNMFVGVGVAGGSEFEFEANTDYAVMVKATGANNVSFNMMTLSDATHRSVFRNGVQLRKGHRNDLTGAFTETTTIVPFIRMRFSHRWEETPGGGSGGAFTFIG